MIVVDPVNQKLEMAVTASGAPLHEVLGCERIDAVSVADDIDAWLDDEGGVNGALPDPIATNMLRALGWHIDANDNIRGAVFFASADAEGRTVSLSDRQHSIVKNAFEQAQRM